MALKHLAAAVLVASLAPSGQLRPAAPPRVEVEEVWLAGLAETVDVYRDAFGTPHIFARSNDDLFAAFGYVTAEDRLFQIDHARRLLSGTLAEVHGAAYLEQDRYYRTIGMRRLCEEIFTRTDRDTKRALEQFTLGVNDYITRHREALPLEFARAGYVPSPWRPQDSILVFKALGHTIDVGGWRVKIGLGEAVARVGDRARDLLPAFAPDAATIIKADDLPGRRSDVPAAARGGLASADESLGSNNWVVSGSRSITGKPLMAADPHYRVTAPPFWYEARLRGGDYDYSGIAIPGSPFMLFGHNADIAWSITAAFIDSVDIYEERLDPARATAAYRDTRDPVRIFDEIIKVKGAPDVHETVRWTRHGPLVTSFVTGASREYALRWTDHERKGDEMGALRLVNRAKDWDAFTRAWARYNTMSVNVLYADRSGNIGYVLAGAIPNRPDGPAHTPIAGWAGAGEWGGFVPFEAHPRLYNPRRGFIATSNNQIVGAWYPHYIGWRGAAFRQERIEELLQSKERWSADDFRAMQWDVQSTQPRRIVPLLMRAFAGREVSPDVKEALGRVAGWSFDFDAAKPAPAIYDAFVRRLPANIFVDDLGADLLGQARLGDVTRILARPDSTWFDDVATPARETHADIIVRSFTQAVAQLIAERGVSQDGWTWGRLNETSIPHVTQAARGGGMFADLGLGPYPKHGRSGWTIDPGGTGSYRTVVDLSQLDTTHALLPPGNSGRPESRHYRDQAELWSRNTARGTYRPLTHSADVAAATATRRLIMRRGVDRAAQR